MPRINVTKVEAQRNLPPPPACETTKPKTTNETLLQRHRHTRWNPRNDEFLGITT